MSEGWVRIHRKILDKEMSPEFGWLWVTMILLANHSQKEVFISGKFIPVDRGQFICSRKSLSKMTKIQESKIERYISVLKTEQQIEQQSFSKYRLITLLNYNEYQISEQQFEQQVNSKRTASEQQVNTTNKLIIKEYKKRKKEKKENFAPPTQEEVNYFFLN